jgi:hypothetical protein
MQVGQESIPGEAAIAATTACKSYAIGQPVTVSFTVSALGPGTSGSVGVSFLFPTGANFTSVTATNSSGLVGK